ncbi:MAG: proline racemase family protein [Thermacetogeniaceae bacterium]|nr:proline racemase family protein [Thermoanaerobacterales bacterium]NLN20425.1 proline racemase [Syntrophomonadaceae bacterium]
MGQYILSYIDAHVAGEPLRLITGGPKLKGKTLVDKTEYMKKNYDFIRKAAMLEPRGHADMYGAYLTEPTDPKADLGIIFIDSALYNAMCGHGSIAIATIAVEMGYVTAQEPVTDVVLETGAGLVTVKVDVQDGRTIGATLQGVPSFLYRSDVEIEVFDQKILVDIVFGGNFFAMVDMKQLNLKHSREYLDQFIRYGKEIRKQANQIHIQHPTRQHITTVDDILFVDDPAFPGDTYKSLVFLGEAQIDRSPCGTGTSARMGALYNKGQLKKDDVFYHESIIGTVFEGRIGSETTVGDFKAIIPLIKSRGYITGIGNLVINTDDPLKDGFLLR